MDEELKQQVANLRGQVDLLIGEKYAKKPTSRYIRDKLFPH